MQSDRAGLKAAATLGENPRAQNGVWGTRAALGGEKDGDAPSQEVAALAFVEGATGKGRTARTDVPASPD